MIYEVVLQGRTFKVDLSPNPDGSFRVKLDGGEVEEVRCDPLGAAEHRLTRGGVTRAVRLALRPEGLFVQHGGHGLRGEVIDLRRAGLAHGEASGQGEVRSPMPGVVTRVLVKAGDDVSAGQVVVVVEAMKMENELRASVNGTVKQVAVAPGQTVEAQALLVSLQPAG